MANASKKLTAQDMLQRLPVSEAELKDLTQKITQFQSTLSPAQLQLLDSAIRPVRSPFHKQARGLDAGTVTELFGDATTQHDLQNFLQTHAGVQAARPVASLVSIAVSIAFEC